MPIMTADLSRIAPFDSLSPEALPEAPPQEARAGEMLFGIGDTVPALFVLARGHAELLAEDGQPVAHRGPGDMVGDRALLAGGPAAHAVRVTEDATLLRVDPAEFRRLVEDEPSFAAWFARSSRNRAPAPYAAQPGLTTLPVRELMTPGAVQVSPDTSVSEAARIMRDKHISSVLVMEGDALRGILSVRDLSGRVLAEGLDGTTRVGAVMTPDPHTIAPDALGIDALMTLSQRGITHLPVVEGGRVAGMVGQTDLFRRQSATASLLVTRLAEAQDASQMAAVMQDAPQLLAHLVATGTPHQAVTRRITDLTDAITRRLLTLGEAKFGAPPVPYLWAACGSQGRQEQTGVSDQDNVLILSDDITPEHDAYFADLAGFVCDGLAECGFEYCPGDMMATNPRWRQPVAVWQSYFDKWIAQPGTEAQMLASVMFDLRPIAGEAALFEGMQAQVLEQASKNSIFVAHMASNAQKHQPPLNLIRGFALIRSGEHRNRLDMKMSGVVPVVDLGRVYALRGQLTVANTRARLVAAQEAGVMSGSGGRDLIDAYDLIADMRLRHQVRRIRQGRVPDNFMSPAEVSDLERAHLRDAFHVIKTMQNAAGQGRGVMG